VSYNKQTTTGAASPKRGAVELVDARQRVHLLAVRDLAREREERPGDAREREPLGPARDAWRRLADEPRVRRRPEGDPTEAARAGVGQDCDVRAPLDGIREERGAAARRRDGCLGPERRRRCDRRRQRHRSRERRRPQRPCSQHEAADKQAPQRHVRCPRRHCGTALRSAAAHDLWRLIGGGRCNRDELDHAYSLCSCSVTRCLILPLCSAAGCSAAGGHLDR
ncbi:unnamed protein product, partial [Pelagomonas calceolata]